MICVDTDVIRGSLRGRNSGRVECALERADQGRRLLGSGSPMSVSFPDRGDRGVLVTLSRPRSCSAVERCWKLSSSTLR